MSKSTATRLSIIGFASVVLGVLILGTSIFAPTKRAYASGGVTALDADWSLVSMSVNSTAQTLPDGTIHYVFDSTNGTMSRYWEISGVEQVDARLDQSATFRGSANWTQDDISQMAAKSLTNQDGVVEFAVAGVTVKCAYAVSNNVATLIAINQTGPWTVPATTIYAIRPEGGGAGSAVYTAPTGNRTLDGFTLTK